MTLTYNPSLAKVKANNNIKNQGHISNGLAVRVLKTHKHTQKDASYSMTLTTDAGGNNYDV